MHDTRKPFWTLDSFDRMNTVIDATLRLIDEVCKGFFFAVNLATEENLRSNGVVIK